MDWKDKCFSALKDADMFEDSWHRTRFKELTDCYTHSPFFSKGLCKCMYLSAWDEEHFCIMLETLTDMSLGRDTNTDEMRINGDILAKEQDIDGYYIFQLSNAFLDNRTFHLDETANVSPEAMHIIKRAIQAAEIIDSL